MEYHFCVDKFPVCILLSIVLFVVSVHLKRIIGNKQTKKKRSKRNVFYMSYVRIKMPNLFPNIIIITIVLRRMR